MKAFLISAAISIFYAQAAFASCGTFEVSKGDVKIIAGGAVQPATGAAVAAAVGSKICAGETVIAGESARAKIKMEDGNELNISPNSKITIETYQYDAASNKKKVMLNVLRGKVRATTKEENMYNDKAKDGQANTFQIRTKSAVAGVRGTDFLTGFDVKTQKMEVVTFRGKVEVGQLGSGGKIVNSVFVAVGQKTEVVGGAAPSIPKAIPAGELMKQNNDSKNETPSANAQPAAAQPTAKQDDKKTDDRTPASSGAVGAGSGSGAGPGSGSMISANDMPASGGPAPLPKMPSAPNAPQLPTAILNSQLLNSVVQNKNNNATVNLQLHVR